MRPRRVSVALALLLILLHGTPAATAEDGAGEAGNTGRAPGAGNTVLRAGRPAVVEMRTAALIMSGQQGGALPIAIAAIPAPGTEAAKITAMVEIDGAALLAIEPAAALATIEIFAYVLGAGLEVVDHRSLRLAIDRSRHREILATTGIKAFIPLEAAAGSTRMRVLVRAGEDLFGVRGQDLNPAAAGVGETRIGTPIFEERTGPWLIVLPGDTDVDLPAPFSAAADGRVPTTRPSLSPGDTVVGGVLVHRPPAQSWTLSALLRGAGTDSAAAPLEILELADSTAGPVAATVSFTAPDLEPGSYEIAVVLTLTSTSSAADAARSPFVAIDLDPAPVAAEAVAAPVPLSLTAEPRRRSERALVRSQSARYLQALRQLAAGQRRDAATTLRTHETSAVDLLDAAALPLLEEAQSRALATLESADWRGVLAVILLHLELTRDYAASRRFILSHHAARRTVDLATAYARQLATPEAEHDAARAVADLAFGFLSLGATSRAEILFGQALELSDDDAGALLALAAIHEKWGRYERAVPLLQRLVAALPELPEGRLRLGLNLLRTDEAATAKPLLEQLTGVGEDWIALLAHQELARIEMDRMRLSAAVDILRRGLERWPGQPTLVIQLAYVLDSKRASAAVSELLSGIGPADGRPAVTARSRYNSWPEGLLRSARRDLADKAASGLPDLQRWLARQPAEEDG